MKKYYILFFTILFLDQLTKHIVIRNIPYQGFIPVIGDGSGLFNLVFVKNTGVAFSAFTGNNTFFLVLASLIVIAAITWALFNRARLSVLQLTALTFITSGGAGNVIDRILHGGVVDFLDFGIGSRRWPSFNVADSSICIGAALLFISIIFFDKPAKPATNPE
ncbi:MAG: signal peptidase II [Elusimicrobia bacterium]|nr:signal peptidase II [Elusimicrobiota bacterium]